MTELVVARSAKFRTGGVVVVRVAFDAHAVRQTPARSSVVQRVPLFARIDDPRIGRLLDRFGRRWQRVIIIIQSLQYQRERSRPSEGKWQHELPAFRVVQSK